ncbi:MAG: SGNH/GDSL hydrolase family protein [Alphaproteobacteria bacterium]|nr:SGNH/GDSL hydrolase family protein [Alphaproteobacteria bacterium]
MPIIQSPAPSLLAPKGLFGGLTINGFGDSITAQGIYQPTDTSIASLPAWQASTAYSLGAYVKNDGFPYYCTQAGTSAGSGGPSGTSNNITDSGAKWAYAPPQAYKYGTSYLFWTEAFSLGALNWDMAQGYAGFYQSLTKIIVVNGGTNYTSPTVTLSSGATGTLTVSNGVITSATITNPGRNASGFTYSINDATGSGAVLCLVSNPSGSFGVPGHKTSDMMNRLADAVASSVDIFVVHGGTNDCSGGVTASTIIANLKTCYETLMAAGKKVVAIPILPRTGLTTAQMLVLVQVNRWIRAYARRESWANSNANSSIMLADPTRYFTDGASTSGAPIGGSGAGAGAMTQDGVHPSTRGAQYMAICILNALQKVIGAVQPSAPRGATMFDGYDPANNLAGNIIEALPWTNSTAYAVIGQLVANDTSPVKVYRLKVAGTSAGSGGPTGTGSTITDGTCQWAYKYGLGASVFGSGSTALSSPPASISYSGNLATGWSLTRHTGTAAGSVTGAIENPWSDGQAGTRQSLAFSLGSGDNKELWSINIINGAYPAIGLQSSDLGANSFYAECEVELSGVANMTSISLQGLLDRNISAATLWNEAGYVTTQGTGINVNMMSSSGEMLPIPNSGKIYLRTQPMILPSNMANVSLFLVMGFNASGGAGSATGTVKVNWYACRRYGV